MITELEEKYTAQQKIYAEINNSIADDFNDLDARLEVFTRLNLSEDDIVSYGLYLQIRDIQDYLKAIEYRVLSEKL